MTSNIEAAKQRYARELAAYTLQQWNVARERQIEREKEGKKINDKSQAKRNPQPPTSTPPPEVAKDDNAATAVAAKVVDFAMRTSSQQKGDT